MGRGGIWRWLVVWGILFTGPAGAEPVGSLLFFSAPYCPYCERFKKEIVPIYPNTPAGRELPMEEVDIQFGDSHQRIARTVRLVPTFVVLDRQGREFNRIVGYRGDEFFWHDLETIHRAMQTPRSGAPAVP